MTHPRKSFGNKVRTAKERRAALVRLLNCCRPEMLPTFTAEELAQLVEYKEKDGVEAKLKLPSKGEVVAALHEACGREVLIVTSGEDEFQGEEAPAEVEKDQPELGIGAEYEEVA